MPIRFETPAPLSARVLEEYGRGGGGPGVQQQVLAHRQQQLEAAGINARSQAAAAGQAQEGALALAGMEQRRQLALAGMEATGADVFQANARAAQSTVDAQNRAWLMQQELSVQEEADLRRYSQAVGEVTARDDLHPDEKRDLLFELRFRVDPLRQRKEAAETRARQAQAEGLVRQAQLMSKLTSADAEERRRAFDMLVLPADPAVGRPAGYFNPTNGKFEAFDAGADRLPPGAMTQSQYHGLRRQAEMDTDRYIADRRAEAVRRKEPPPNIDRDAILRQTQESYGIKPTYEEQVGRGGGGAPGPGGSPPPAGPGQPGQPGPGQSAPPRDARVVMEETEAQFQQRPMSPETKAMVSRTFDKWKARLASAGGYKGLSAEEKEQFDADNDWLRQLDQSLPPPAAPAPAAAAPPAPSVLGRVGQQFVDQARGIPAAIRSTSPFR